MKVALAANRKSLVASERFRPADYESRLVLPVAIVPGRANTGDDDHIKSGQIRRVFRMRHHHLDARRCALDMPEQAQFRSAPDAIDPVMNQKHAQVHRRIPRFVHEGPKCAAYR
ncbi:hypothetical protein C0099_06785 [Pseudazoarcus pumilus]|uniref:Uncharacterized protein n=1 Tax=Pseudazoarcus pumilus TaxID=2067960 RepID=A0A2I6S605_9RHOO|nr:hypothetical protein C0099_06785 [Pseudazoarcus pumilus]